jgi:hypothetical protein
MFTKEALIHLMLINEVNNMKNFVLQAITIEEELWSFHRIHLNKVFVFHIPMSLSLGQRSGFFFKCCLSIRRWVL